jgi:opacity protein-like surface antigen
MFKGENLMNRKVGWVLGVLVLAAALLALPGPAKAEMYVEGYLGGVTAGGLDSSTNVKTPFTLDVRNARQQITTLHFSARGNLPGHPNAAVIGGLKIGYWFVPTGFAGYSYPDWMKYLGVYTDFSYHRLDVRQTQFTGKVFVNNVLALNAPADFESEGTVATWAFMLAARYGFFPDSEVPFGRLQPYVAVGPAVLFSTQRPKITVSQTPFGISPGSQSSTDIALAVDAGIRYMCLKNVSIDLSFKYRWANPSYEYRGNLSNPFGVVIPTSFKYEPTYNLFSGQLGVAYHF